MSIWNRLKRMAICASSSPSMTTSVRAHSCAQAAALASKAAGQSTMALTCCKAVAMGAAVSREVATATNLSTMMVLSGCAAIFSERVGAFSTSQKVESKQSPATATSRMAEMKSILEVRVRLRRKMGTSPPAPLTSAAPSLRSRLRLGAGPGGEGSLPWEIQRQCAMPSLSVLPLMVARNSTVPSKSGVTWQRISRICSSAREAKRSNLIVAARPAGEIHFTVRVSTPVRRSSDRSKLSTVPLSSEKRSSSSETVNGSQSGALASSVKTMGAASNTP